MRPLAHLASLLSSLPEEFKESLFVRLPSLYAMIAEPLRGTGPSTASHATNNNNNISVKPSRLVSSVPEDLLLTALHLYSLLLPSLSHPEPLVSFLEEFVPLLIDALSSQWERARDLAATCIASSCALGSTKVSFLAFFLTLRRWKSL